MVARSGARAVGKGTMALRGSRHEVGGSTDQALVDRVRVGDARALRLVIDDYGSAVFGMARRIAVDPTLAEEIAQDVFLTLWRKPDGFDRVKGSLKTYLLVIARNKAVDAVRKQETYERSLRKIVPGPESISPIDRVVDRDGIQAALAELSPRQREAVVLAYYGGFTYREVAGQLGVPEGTAKSRIYDGLARLKGMLEPSHTT